MPEEQFSEFYKLLNGCVNKIIDTLGPGYKENIYQNALAIKLRQEGCDVRKEVNVPIFFEGDEIGAQRLDLVVESDYTHTCIIELKTLSKINEKEKNQIRRYLDVWEEDTGNIANGYLVNFGLGNCEIISIERERDEDGDDDVFMEAIEDNAEEEG